LYPYEGFIKYNIEGQDIELIFSLDKVLINEHVEISIKLINKGNVSVFELSVKPKKEIQIVTLLVKARTALIKTDKVYINGFQTWTESREYGIAERIPKLNRLTWNILSPYGDYTFYPHTNQRGIYHSFTYTYINRNNENYTLYGSLSETLGYTIFEYNTEINELHIIKDCRGLSIKEEYKAFELLLCSGDQNEVFQEYFDVMNINKPSVKPCTGWTSWYNYYTGITEEIIINNLNAFSNRNIPIDTFQIDDGYENAVGDWLIVNDKFPRGMKYIAESVKDKGYKAGLWLAPFICEKKSKFYYVHNNWLLRDENGRLIRAGFNPGWSGTFYALDFYNQEVRDYLRKTFDVVLKEWGFDMVKLDFLYAVALIPRKYKTRGQIMHEAMEFIREIVGEKIILGCGVPLGPSFGLVDYCRIGSDVALKWEDKLLKVLNYRERVSTINAIISTIGRRHLNRKAFYNDPDVFILREKNNKLTKNQRNTLFILNLIFGGLVFTSVNINEYSEEEMMLYLSMFPIREKSIEKVERTQELCRVEFKIDNRSYLAISNLSDKEIKVHLNEGEYFEKTIGFIFGSTDILLKPYETICLLMLQNKDYEIAGSDNIFPGNEVIDFEVDKDNIILIYTFIIPIQCS
jgi:alpha-galactosidase